MSGRVFHLAQVNIALPRESLNSELLADFIAALAPINALAEASPGFVWRLQGDAGDATAVRGFGDDRILVNMSTWDSIDAFAKFVFGSSHAEIMRSRRKWFVPMKESYAALWWVPFGHRPNVREAEERIAHLRMHGPTAFAFSLKQTFLSPDSDAVKSSDGKQ